MAKASYLVIVESPSKAKTIGKYLGPDYTVRASMGHLRDLPKSTMGVDIEGGFIPQYLPLSGKGETISELKKLSAGAEFIVVLTGAIMTMPGLPKKPAAYSIDVDDDGNITGLF